MKNAGKLSILLPLSIGFCATVLAVAGGLSANVAYADTTNGANGTNTANLKEVRSSAQNPNDSKAEADKYPTVTFMNGDSTIATVQVKKGNSTGGDTPSGLKDTGYKFLGWSTTKGATEQAQVDFTATTPVSADTTVYAVFKKDKDDPAQKASVTFNIDGASVNTERVEKGKTLGNSMPAQPTKTGYKFVGWSTNKNAVAADFTADTAVSSDTTVYAVFKRDVVMQKVTFRSSKGNAVIQEIQVEKGQKVTSIPSVAAPIDYIFVRWNSRQDGKGSAFDSNKRITQDITVYAIFKKNPGVIDIVPEPIPPDPDFDPLNPDGDSTQKYSVTFKNEGNVISTVNVKRGETVKSTDMPKNPQKDGYTFLGWSTKKNTSDKADVDFTSTTQVYDDKTVYAVFEKNPVVMYDVTFKNDDAWLSTHYVKQNKTLGSSNLPAQPTKSGYDFVGWSTNKNASAADFSANSEITEDKIIYAVFKPKSYESSHDVVFENDGSWIKTVQVADKKTVTDANMPDKPTKSGYKFVGWSTEKNATTENFSATTAITADTTVYAVFKKDEHPVTVEVLVAKMTYKGSSDLTFKSTNKKSDPVDGKKVTDGSGKVTLNTPATDGVTEVGNKQVVEGVPLKQNYDIVSDPRMDFGKSRVVDGEDISSSIVTIYKVDSNRGLTDEIESEKTEYSTPSVKSYIYVGNVKKETKDIPFKTTYVSSDSLSYKSVNVKIDGKSGKKNITTTYKLSDNPDANYIGDVDSAHEAVTNPVVDKVIEIGNVEKKTSDILFKTIYVADGNLDYKATKETAGKNGKEEIALTYKVDATNGLMQEVESKKSLCTKPVDHVIRVGNVDRKTTEIKFKTIEKNDSSLNKGERRVQTQGKNGSDVVITTYVVNSATGLTDTVESVRGKHIDAVDEVVLVGTKEELPTPPNLDPNPNPNSNPDPDPNPYPNPNPEPNPNPTDPDPNPTDPGDNNGGGSIDPDWTYNPELNIGGGNGGNINNDGNGGNTNNTNGSGNGSGVGINANNGANNGFAVNDNSGANRGGSSKLQAEGTRSADALPNTGSNASSTTFASFGAMVLGLFAAGIAANRKRAKHLR